MPSSPVSSSSAAAPGRRPAGSPTSCAPRPSAGCCWSAPPWSRWSGPTRRGGRATTPSGATTVGPAALHLDLTLATWAADGLLAIFFFVAGLELKREFVAGDLRDPRRAALPVAAAVGGMAVPALLYVAVNLRGGDGALAGLGDPHRDRHRVRAGRARGDQHAPARGAAHLPAHPRRGRRPARDHHHRDLLHRCAAPRCRCCWRCSRWRCSRCWCSAGCGPGGCCCRWPPRPGRWCTPPACTPPSPGCCSASPSR